MKREVSTSTIGGDEARKSLMAAYMFQRRVLLGCSVAFVLSLLVWIIAISTDHWIIISGGGGIFIPETRRFFMSSHSGLWRHCRNTILPSATPNANVVRNFTSIAFTNPNALNDGKIKASLLNEIKLFRDEFIELPMTNFTEAAKKRMFAHWLRNEEPEFQTLKTAYHNLVLSDPDILATIEAVEVKPIEVDPLNISAIITENTFGRSLQKVMYNSNLYLFVIPETTQLALFEDWNTMSDGNVARLIWPYARDLGLPAFVVNDKHVIMHLVPPKPRKSRFVNGYEYTPISRCKYIDMFPNANVLRNEPGFDDTLMDYIRTQASFACITVFVMCLGAVFSFYTFMNPRYMFKRLAGGIHLVSASSAIVVIQVLLSSVEYTKEHLFYAYPDGAVLKYGYGVYLAWFTFVINIICGVMFLWYSGKKKGAKAASDELAMADEPTIMGR